MATVAPPTPTQLPFASVTLRVTTSVLVPSAVIVVLPAARTEHTGSAGPATPDALKVTGEPVSPAAEAVTVFAQAVVQSVQLPTVAMPVALVRAVAPVSDPPPPVTAKVTGTPATGWFQASVTSTLGAVATAAPAMAVWVSPACATICLAGGTTLNLKLLLQERALRPIRPRTFHVRLA